MNNDIWNSNNKRDFKLYDKVMLTYLNRSGYIDAITGDSYRVRTADGYEWIRKGDTDMIHADENDNNKSRQKYDKFNTNYLG